MKKININNEINNRQYVGEFENDIQLDSWKNFHINNNSWGLAERKMEFVPEELQSRILSQEEKIRFNDHLQENETYIEYTIKSDYVITIEDITTDYMLDQLRIKRDIILQSTDKYMLSDYPITTEVKNQYISYRQYLRDLPDSVVLPENPMTFEEFILL